MYASTKLFSSLCPNPTKKIVKISANKSQTATYYFAHVETGLSKAPPPGVRLCSSPSQDHSTHSAVARTQTRLEKP